MAHLGLRTIYGQEDLERASQAPGRIVGMYSNFESMNKGGALTSDNFDSGLGAEVEDGDLSLGEAPARPKLITEDPEKQDSGLGREAESDDDIEKDHVAVETRSPVKVFPTRPGPLEKQAPAPRRPRRTIVPGRASTMHYGAPSQPSSLTSNVSSGSGTSYHVRTVPAQAEEEVQRMHLQNQWRRILLQQQLNYLLPNKEGDT